DGDVDEHGRERHDHHRDDREHECGEREVRAAPADFAHVEREQLHSSRLPSNARPSVIWSVNSRSPPWGTPLAMRETRVPSGFSSCARYMAVASPSTLSGVATTISSTPS